MLLNKNTSKRKIWGLYEYVLNAWLSQKIQSHSNFIDIGANNGYHTYGFSYAASRAGHRDVRVISVEPDVGEQLLAPRNWNEYRSLSIDIIEKYCRAEPGEGITIHDLISNMESGLIKMDIEGGEREVIPSNIDILSNRKFDWCIEIHGKDLIVEIAAAFCSAKRPFLIKDMPQLPFIGGEPRPILTTWLVTI
ncbi:hypothetical protein [Prosthecomicrobium pneumaticum]|uniref:Methyltransferase FkbM domain-containing protein n=1 Tax=Prosthecomicrobium pneumaticum TaxID=81895 RepID=A0A7W9CUW9_9HYPH|nr:hypothetical protein [Prosthecomicrobium pneumaticum]MBB5751971.1 hypothetical protein [Prosthecomicrobium pneumaticum]